MGGMKDVMLTQQEDEAAAARYLVSVGMLDKCDYHGTLYGGGGWDLESEFYRNAVADWKRGAAGSVPWAAGMGVREYTDLLKAAYEEHCGDSCSYCDKLRSE